MRQSLHQNYQFPWQLRGPRLRELININRDTTVHRLPARITALFRAHMPLPSHGIGSNYGRKRTPAPCGYSSLAILSRFSQLPNDASKTTGDQDCALSLERPRCRVKSSLIADLPIRPRSLKRNSAVHFQAVVQTSLRNGVGRVCKMVEVEAGQGSSAIFSKTPTTRS